MQGISWLAENQLASQEGLCSMEYGISKPTEFSKGFFTIKMSYCFMEHVCMCYFRKQYYGLSWADFFVELTDTEQPYMQIPYASLHQNQTRCEKYG